MRAVVQRVSRASVSVEGVTLGEIGPGLLIFLGVGHGDTETEAAWLAEKIANLRVFETEGRMDRSLLEVGGGALAISQFTLYGDCRKGRRPDFTAAARPETALPLYRSFCQALRGVGVTVAEGEFGAYMEIAAVNDGPVTIILERAAS